MQRRLPWFLVSMSVALPAGARTLTDVSFPVGEARQGALAFARAQRAAFGATDAELSLDRVLPLRGGAVVRLVQTHRGLPVLGAGVAVTIHDQRVVAASGTLAPIALPDVTPRISADRAAATVLRANSTAVVRGRTLAVWAARGVSRLVWALDVRTTEPFGLFRALVDAQEGTFLLAESRLREAKGWVYATSPSQGNPVERALGGLLSTTQLTGEFVETRRCLHEGNDLKCDRKALADADGNYPYQPEAGVEDPFAEVQAYYHVDTFHRWLKETFGFARSRQNQKIMVSVNYHYVPTAGGQARAVGNAFFGDLDGDGVGDLTFGQVQGRDFAYDADVVYHEFTHSVVDETSDLSATVDSLGFNLMPGALNEAFADLMSAMYTGDGVVGEYAGGGSGGIRDLSGTATCDELTGETHQDGLIWGRAHWALFQQTEQKHAVLDLVYRTMVGLGRHATFEEASALLLKLARELYPALVPSIETIHRERGLLSCSRILELRPGSPRRGYVLGTSVIVGGQGVVPAGLQYRIDVPANAHELQIDVVRPHGPLGKSPIGAYIRKGSPVSYTGLKADYDLIKANDVTSITVRRSDETAPLQPGAVYYVLPLNVGSRDSTYEVRASFTLEEGPVGSVARVAQAPAVAGQPVSPSAGSSSDEAQAPASGCAVAPRTSSALETGMLLALFASLAFAVTFAPRRRRASRRR
ncbi:MAG: hypothetical protein IT371_22710 [Deltaproteobacteria bacterium]|nr:hypothetical protein [Deltaproteobacteria bacterium]